MSSEFEFSAPAGQLLSAVAVAASGIEKHASMPILEHVLIDLNRRHVTGTNLEMEVRADLAFEGRGACAIHAARLLTLLRQLPEECEVIGRGSEDALDLRAGRSRFRLNTLHADAFPEFDPGDGFQSVFRPVMDLPAETLGAALASVAGAMAVQDVRYYLNGVYMLADEVAFTLVASDGHRLSKFEFACEASMQEAIVPRHAVPVIAKLCANAQSVSVSMSSSAMRFAAGPVAVACKLIAGKYPDWRRVWPAGSVTRTLTVERHELLSALRLGATMASEKIKAVELVASESGLCVNVRNPQDESGEVEVAAMLEGEAFTLGVNVTYLIDAISRMPGDVVRVGVPAAANAILLTGDDGRAGHVVMPMRV